jgi:hypothetical protein
VYDPRIICCSRTWKSRLHSSGVYVGKKPSAFLTMPGGMGSEKSSGDGSSIVGGTYTSFSSKTEERFT